MKNTLVITMSFLFALILEIIPMSWLANWMRPEWVLLVLIYWVMVLPDKVGVSIAFILGLLMDLIKGSLLGEHALAFVIIAYIIARFCPRIRLLPLMQQMVVIFLFLFVYQTFQFWMWSFSGVGIGEAPVTDKGMYWLSSLTSVIIWPLVYTFLRFYQNRYKVY